MGWTGYESKGVGVFNFFFLNEIFIEYTYIYIYIYSFVIVWASGGSMILFFFRGVIQIRVEGVNKDLFKNNIFLFHLDH